MLVFGALGLFALLPATAPSTSPTIYACVRTPQLRAPAVRASLADERIESLKASTMAAISGSIVAVPTLSLSNTLASVPEWEYAIGMLAAQLALFGAVYRCTVRCDDNKMLRQGAVGAAALCRALASLPLSSTWTPDLSSQLFGHFGEGLVVFGFAAAAIERTWQLGLARPLAGWSPELTYEEDFYGRESDYYGRRGSSYDGGGYYGRDENEYYRSGSSGYSRGRNNYYTRGRSGYYNRGGSDDYNRGGRTSYSRGGRGYSRPYRGVVTPTRNAMPGVTPTRKPLGSNAYPRDSYY